MQETSIAFVLARAGSKGLPGKNIVPFAGEPLIVHTIRHAQECPEIDRIIVSTDGEDIASAARQAGAEVMMRPHHLATDTALPKDAILHHLEELAAANEEPDILTLLQPTSPLRQPQDISACLKAIIDDGYTSAATFQRSPSSPYRAWLHDSSGLRPFIEGHDPWRPRQQLPSTFALNGAVYAARTQAFKEDDSHSFLPGTPKLVEMPAVRSIDIDDDFDLDIAETVYKKLQAKG